MTDTEKALILLPWLVAKIVCGVFLVGMGARVVEAYYATR